jgi:hypothetical protein
MTHEAQNRAVAEALGRRYHKPSESEVASGSYYQYEPDYGADSQINQACLDLPESKQKELRACLFKMCGEMFAHLATAQQKRKAFLVVQGKWTDA